MPPLVTSPNPSPSSSGSQSEGGRFTERQGLPGCLGVGLWGSLKCCRPQCPSHLAGLEQGQGCLLEMKRLQGVDGRVGSVTRQAAR